MLVKELPDLCIFTLKNCLRYGFRPSCENWFIKNGTYIVNYHNKIKVSYCLIKNA